MAAAADRDRRQQEDEDEQQMVDQDGDEMDMDGDWDRSRGERHDEEDEAEGGDDDGLESVEYTEAGLQALKAMQTSLAEQQYALGAIAAAQIAGYFPDMPKTDWDLSGARPLLTAGGNEVEKLERWKERMEADVRNKALADDEGLDQDGAGGRSEALRPGGSVSTLTTGRRTVAPPSVFYTDCEGPEVERALDPVAVKDLRMAQFRAYDIRVWHLEQALQGEDVSPLRMIIHGEGGTGKSRVIQTVTEAFKTHRSAFLLVKAAYTGIAASLIDGKTTHVIARIKVGREGQNSKLSDEAKRTLQVFWRRKRYLVLDEYSMLAKTFLTNLSRNIATGVEGTGLDSNAPFGGISVILCGDLHQFAPVACSAREALYRPADPAFDTLDQAIGRDLYERFDKVVILDEQMRVTDPDWSLFLKALRAGEVTAEQVRHFSASTGLGADDHFFSLGRDGSRPCAL